MKDTKLKQDVIDELNFEPSVDAADIGGRGRGRHSDARRPCANLRAERCGRTGRIPRQRREGHRSEERSPSRRNGTNRRRPDRGDEFDAGSASICLR